MEAKLIAIDLVVYEAHHLRGLLLAIILIIQCLPTIIHYDRCSAIAKADNKKHKYHEFQK